MLCCLLALNLSSQFNCRIKWGSYWIKRLLLLDNFPLSSNFVACPNSITFIALPYKEPIIHEKLKNLKVHIYITTFFCITDGIKI